MGALSSVVERFIDIEKVTGSIPVAPTKHKNIGLVPIFFILGLRGLNRGGGRTLIFVRSLSIVYA